jgi:hypothetical protein
MGFFSKHTNTSTHKHTSTHQLINSQTHKHTDSGEDGKHILARFWLSRNASKEEKNQNNTLKAGFLVKTVVYMNRDHSKL